MASAAQPSGFAERVAARRVDLIARVEEGLPPVEYLRASEGILIVGKRHLIAAPRKTGKSIGMLVHWARMALADARVIVLDRENGADLYARRLHDITLAWSLRPRDKNRLRTRLEYYEFPRLRPGDGDEFCKFATGADVVVFDSQRMFLTDFGFDEDNADDYARFMHLAVDPLFRAGVATVILDNTGHSNKSRSRGSSAKGDLNEVLFTMETEVEFSRTRQGKLRLKLDAGNSRFGNEGEWVMHIGGGAFSEWKRVGDERPVEPAFRKAAEAALFAAGIAGLSQTKLLEAIKEAGVPYTNQVGREWLYRLAADPDVAIDMLPAEKSGLPIMFFGGPGSDA